MIINIHQVAANIASQLSETSCSQPFGPDCDVYKVFDKVFLMIFKLQGKRVINLKVEPQRGEMLRDFYPFIHAGYHMNKQHWISVYQDDALD
nr:MmcQ/YjbR family DNA-binding protein [Acinetobacter sp. ANC 4470]